VNNSHTAFSLTSTGPLAKTMTCISQGSVATHLTCARIFNDDKVEEFWKNRLSFGEVKGAYSGNFLTPWPMARYWYHPVFRSLKYKLNWTTIQLP